MSDKNIKQKNPTFIIMKRELKSYFSGPIGYIVTGLFLIISGFIFFSTFFKSSLVIGLSVSIQIDLSTECFTVILLFL